MATRNFYERDSVAAQLLWSLLNGEPQTAADAAYELLASEESELLFAYLTLAWWFQTPRTDGIQKARVEAFLSKEPTRLLPTLLPAAGFIVPLPPLTPSSPLPPPSTKGDEPPPPATWTVWPAGWNACQAGKGWRAVDEALRKGNFRRATFLTLPFCSQTAVVVDFLKSLDFPAPLYEAVETTLFQPLVPRILEHCFAAVVALGTTDVVPLRSSRDGRCFRISEKALACWGVPAPPLSRLRGPPALVSTADATAYWQKACAAAKAAGGFNPQKPMLFEDSADADVVEGFYATHFPYDIPEEWTRAEKEKSHFARPLEKNNDNPWILAFCV